LGFDIVDRLAEKSDVFGSGQNQWFDYWWVPSPEGKVALIKPVTYVNNSGPAVREALRMFDFDPTELFVISDDFQISLGSLRIRKSGSSGGHNGLESIIDTLGRNDFARMRAGIGPLPEWAVVDGAKIPEFVLGNFEPGELKIVKEMISLATEALEIILNDSLDLAISRYNKVNPTPEQ
jgi:PTH1 family peptidyl-tRNA hydrolase